MDTCYVGIDLGGTNIKGGVVDPSGKVLCFESTATEAARGPAHVLDRIAALVATVRDAAGVEWDSIAAVGIGSPGPLNTRTGVIHDTPNLPGWVNLPLADEVSRRCGYPVVVENDANAAALAEAVVGAGKGLDCMLMLTLGTGIGGGIVIGGRVWHGADDHGGELGHISVCSDGARCNCGSIGCVEAYASATGVVRRTVEALAAGGKSYLKNAEKITAAKVFQAAAMGDELAGRIVADTIVCLATAMGSLINTFNPDMIVLFGGMTNAGEQLFGPLLAEVARRCFSIGALRCQIVRSQLGDHAGVIGAAIAARQRLEEAATA